MGGGPRGGRQSYASGGSKNTSIVNYAGSSTEKPKVFISFHTADMHQINLLRHQAQSPSFEMEFEDNSAVEPFTGAWRAKMRQKILNSHTFMVAIGPETYKREAVQWEIKTAYQMGKPVIGVRLYSNKNHSIPEQMVENGAYVVNWNMKEISYALENN